MLQNHRSFLPRVRGPSWAAGLLWCAAALSTGYWFWQWPVTSMPSGASISGVQSGSSVQVGDQLPRALGAAESTSARETNASRLQLVGVIASISGQGSALIAVDGQPPKPYRVGQVVGEGLVLQSLSPKRAQLGASLSGPVVREMALQPGAAP